jgi:UDP-N-acetylglucosamine diphosphorylase/glucosamine-1-phosphate N-acetyltransferase
MNYILFDNSGRDRLLPLVFTRPVADIRVGILTIREKWERLLQEKTSTYTENYLQKKFPLKIENDNLFINASVLPSRKLVDDILKLKKDQSLTKEGLVIAKRMDVLQSGSDLFSVCDDNTETELEVATVEYTWDIFAKNDQAIRNDFELLTKGRSSAPLSESNFIRGDKRNIFLEEGASVEFAFLNAESGPIYVGKDAEIMEGAKIRGPFALCNNSTLKLDAKIYGATTIGPHCKVGGEVSNSVFFGYANKAHDGYLGNAVICEWCNLGADTNNSNLKNTYDIVKLWSYAEEKFVNTGLQFCGLIMGDHSKTGINTMFNTGTVIGVSCNLYGSGFPRNFIPSFSWGSPLAMKEFNFNKACQVAEAVMKRRGIAFDETEQEIMEYLFQETKSRR